MLKLEQIAIQSADELIVEILEPIVYLKAGVAIKTDDIISKEKAQAPYLIAKVVKKHISKLDQNTSNERPIQIGDFVMINRHCFTPITFPIEGYAKPSLATLHKDAVFAIIEEELAQCNPPADTEAFAHPIERDTMDVEGIDLSKKVKE